MLTTVAAGRAFDYSYCIGMYAMAGQGFWSPRYMVVGPDEVVFVLSRGMEELGQRITRVTLTHDFQGQFGSFGAGEGQFIWPRSIAMDSENEPLRLRRATAPYFSLRPGRNFSG